MKALSAQSDSELLASFTTGRELTIQNCIFEASGPIKVTEHETCGMVLKVLNNTFNMHNKNNKANEFRNDAIYLSGTSGGGSTLGDVLIQGKQTHRRRKCTDCYAAA